MTRLRETSLPVRQTIALTFGGLILLQFWRPCYFLTDDNLTWWLPLATQAARRVWNGESPFWNEFIFGGVDLRRDATTLCLWNPIVWIWSWLGRTPLYFVLADVVGSSNVLLATTGFALLAVRLRAARQLAISHRRIVFLSLSYGFSAWMLIVGSSWHQYLANAAALPFLALGLWQTWRSWGIACIAFGALHGLLAGHPGPWAYSLLFFGLLAGLWSMGRRQIEPILRLTIGILLAILVAAPLLLPALGGFAATNRMGALSTLSASQLAVPPGVLLVSLWGGTLSALTGEAFAIGYLNSGHGYAIGASAASGLVVISLFGKRRLTALEIALLGLIGLTALLVVRPVWLANFISHVPIFRSLRWPFKEVLWLVFWLHLMAILRPIPVQKPLQRGWIGCGLTAWLFSLTAFGPPSFNAMKLDRELILSGRAAAFWRDFKPTLPAQSQLIADIPTDLSIKRHNDVPWTLLGAYNYPALWEVHSLSGYTVTGFRGARRRPTSGVFSPAERQQWLRQDSRVVALSLRSVEPLKIEIFDAKGRRELRLPLSKPPDLP